MNKDINDLVPFNVNPRQIAISPIAADSISLQLRDKLVTRAKELAPITDLQSDSLAVEVGREIRRVIKSANERFTELKRPILDAGTLLKTLLDAFVQPLQAEQERLERQHTLWQQAEQRRIDQEAETQRLEIQKKQAEADEANRKAQEALERIKGPVTLDKALKAQGQAKAAQESVIAAMTAPVPTLVKPQGAALRKKLQYRVTDVKKVYESNPMLCKPLEIRPAAVNLLVPAKEATKEKPDTTIPGIEIWMEADTSFRA